jgi:hypothetical protein
VVSPTGKQTKHAGRISFIAGLAENLASDDDHCVCPQNDLVRYLMKCRIRFLARQAFRAITPAFSRLR